MALPRPYPLKFCKLPQNLTEEEKYDMIRLLEHVEAEYMVCPYSELREWCIDVALQQGLIPRRPEVGEYICPNLS